VHEAEYLELCHVLLMHPLALLEQSLLLSLHLPNRLIFQFILSTFLMLVVKIIKSLRVANDFLMQSWETQ